MPDPIKFYFDFSSPYSYFASLKIEDTCEAVGRELVWKPFLLGVLLKSRGAKPSDHSEDKQKYRVNDWERMARFMGTRWSIPDPFPIPTQVPARAFYWIHDNKPKVTGSFVREVFAAYFSEGRNISLINTVLEIAMILGIDRDELETALLDDDVKKRLRDETNSAIDSGVCGAPYFIVDNEGFWGNDRIWMVRKWIEHKGW